MGSVSVLQPSRLALLDESHLFPLGDLLVPNELRVHALLGHVLRLLHALDGDATIVYTADCRQ
jgi:hypothetical protein